MSIESAKAYIERLKADEEFSERMKATEDKEARMTLVKAEGFDFSEDDIKAVASELSGDDLVYVEGGSQAVLAGDMYPGLRHGSHVIVHRKVFSIREFLEG